MLFSPYFVFTSPAAPFLLLFYLIGFQKSHCEEYLEKAQEATTTCDISAKC